MEHKTTLDVIIAILESGGPYVLLAILVVAAVIIYLYKVAPENAKVRITNAEAAKLIAEKSKTEIDLKKDTFDRSKTNQDNHTMEVVRVGTDAIRAETDALRMSQEHETILNLKNCVDTIRIAVDEFKKVNEAKCKDCKTNIDKENDKMNHVLNTTIERIEKSIQYMQTRIDDLNRVIIDFIRTQK